MEKARNSLVFFFVLVLSLGSAFGQVVFKSGTEGYETFRIPAIVKAPNGDLLAFCEGRLNGGADFGNIDLVMKRSSDQGNSWSKLEVIVDQNTLQAGNPGPVVDLMDPNFPNGRIFLFYNTGNTHESEIRKGKGIREVWYITSVDQGLSWSEPVNITSQVHKPYYPPVYKEKEDWRWYAITPGHAVQSTKGKFKGRMFIPANHSLLPKSDGTDYRSHGFYTDDHGETFQLSPSLAYPGSNEATAAFIGKKLILNARDQSGKSKRRVIAISEDGGATWSEEYVDKHLLDPVNEGSLLLLGDNKTLGFSNARSTKHRNNLSIQLSKDEGRTWYKSIRVDGTDDKEKERSYTAYSDLVNLSKKKVGVLYERNGYSEIVFKSIDWK